MATRELSITYGGTTFGGSSGREISNAIINTKKFQEASVEFDFYIYKTTEAAFSTEITAVEDALRKPFQDLTITQGSTDIYTYKQSTNTGLDAQPEILKMEPGATGRSRRYRARITVGLPANTTAELQSGLREHTVEVAYDPARIRTVTITGTVTAVGGSNARTQYESIFSALESSVFTALSIAAANRELIEEPVANHTYNTKTLTFRRVWRELIFSQGGASLDDAEIVRQILRIARKKEAPGDTPETNRLVTLTLSYEAWIDKTVSTNLRGKYDGMRQWLITQLKDTLGGGSVALIEEIPEFSYDENRLSVTMVAFGTGPGALIEFRLSTEDDELFGIVLIPVWNGDPFGRYNFQGPGVRRRTITDTRRVLAGGGGFVAGGPRPQIAQLGISSGFIWISTKKSTTPLRLGLPGTQFDVNELMTVDVYEFANLVKPTPSGAPVATPGGGG